MSKRDAKKPRRPRAAPKSGKKRKTAEGGEAADEAEEAGVEAVELFCLCRQPDDGREFIECDSCNQWYHCECVGVNLQVQHPPPFPSPPPPSPPSHHLQYLAGTLQMCGCESPGVNIGCFAAVLYSVLVVSRTCKYIQVTSKELVSSFQNQLQQMQVTF